MVQQDSRLDPPGCRFVISPNCSLTWREARVILAGVAIIALTIGVAFYSVGLKLVLPFSGLEVAALVAAFYFCQWRAGTCEVVSIDEQRVIVERGREKPTLTEKFQRAWVRVVLVKSQNDWYPSQLKLCSHGREFEIGGFLNEEERTDLARRLVQAVRIAGAGRAELRLLGEETKKQ